MIVFRAKIFFFAAVFYAGPLSLSAAGGDPYRLYIKGYLTKSAEEYVEKYKQDPSDLKPLLNATIVYKQLGLYQKAIDLLVKALIAEPENTEVLCELGWLKFHTAQYEDAESLFGRALKLRPLYARAVLGMGSVLSHLGKKEEGIEYLTRYKELRPDFAGADYIIAWNYFNFDMPGKAKEHLINALRKDPSFVEARLPLAGIYAREKKFNEAWNQYYRVLDYAPGHPIASKMTEMLEGKLTKQPEEIRPPFKFRPPEKVPYIDIIEEIEKSVNLRVGIGTNVLGRQKRNNRLKFSVPGGFKIIGKRSGKVYASAGSNEIWSAQYSGGRVVVKDPRGTLYGRFKGPILIVPKKREYGYVLFERDRHSSNPWFRNSDRAYRGYIELSPGRRGIDIVNVVDMEVYLLGVVPAEVMSWWPYETLKTQAVIARTQAIIRRERGGKHKRRGYHLCDSQHCQVYHGVIAEDNRANKAIYDTEGEILIYGGKPAQTFYHSNCGGYMQASEDATGWRRVDYLESRQDISPGMEERENSPWDLHRWITSNPPANCNIPEVTPAVHYRWLRIIKHKDMQNRLNKEYKIGRLIKIIPLRRSVSGNVNSIRIVGSRKNADIDREHLIRNILGLTSIKSTLIFIEINRFPSGKIRNYWIYGGGWGHGIGLCQTGAAGMAGKYGKNYREILGFYFPGTEIKKLKYIRRKNK